MLVRIAIAALLAVLPLASQQTPKGRKTVVGISGPKFTILPIISSGICAFSVLR